MLPPGYTLRAATPADAVAKSQVHGEAIRALGDVYTSQQLSAWAGRSPQTTEHLAACLAAGDVVFVCECAGQLIAFGERSGEYIRAVYVHPDHVKRGVGSALLDALEKSAVAQGIRQLRLDSSLNAERFYHSHGFEVERRGTHPLRDGTPLECVFMRKSLAREES